ncbi:MAG: response regulator transcription factor [Bacteroidaceae bacterium]|nr:response regulator transcription factor [Bacteroidales bacterium]MBP3671539.1 response regulator transcription factor [Bacteroidaceae bacterium]MBQ2978641.1 response regulator transcription factor [Bacteroidaceae bacterium]
MTTNKRIVIIEPYAMIAHGLRLMIDDIKGYEVSAVIADSHYLERIVPLRPDIVIVNPAMIDSRRRGFLDEMSQRLPGSLFAALVYQYIEPEVIRNFKVTIDISDSREKIAVKLRQLLETGEQVVESLELSDREKEILVAVAKGLTNKTIAEQYHLSVHTVITHRKNITRKTGIKSVSGLTVYAILNNLIDISEVE